MRWLLLIMGGLMMPVIVQAQDNDVGHQIVYRTIHRDIRQVWDKYVGPRVKNTPYNTAAIMIAHTRSSELPNVYQISKIDYPNPRITSNVFVVRVSDHTAWASLRVDTKRRICPVEIDAKGIAKFDIDTPADDDDLKQLQAFDIFDRDNTAKPDDVEITVGTKTKLVFLYEKK